MVGKTYYAAIKETEVFSGESHIFGMVAPIEIDPTEHYNFSYKALDECMTPFHFDCPSFVLNALSVTDDVYALVWRKKCAEQQIKKNKTRLHRRSLLKQIFSKASDS